MAARNAGGDYQRILVEALAVTTPDVIAASGSALLPTSALIPPGGR
jgi:hypothetical protein